MASKSISKKRRDDYLSLLNTMGEQGLFKSIVGVGMKQSVQCNNPEESILDEADAMLTLFRRTGVDDFLLISQILRRAAHVVHRQLILQDPNKRPNRKRFLHSVA